MPWISAVDRHNPRHLVVESCCPVCTGDWHWGVSLAVTTPYLFRITVSEVSDVCVCVCVHLGHNDY